MIAKKGETDIFFNAHFSSKISNAKDPVRRKNKKDTVKDPHPHFSIIIHSKTLLAKPIATTTRIKLLYTLSIFVVEPIYKNKIEEAQRWLLHKFLCSSPRHSM